MGYGEIIAIIAVVLVIGGAVAYIIKAKKSGKKCIGCPDSSSCSGKCSGSCSSCSACREHEKSDNEK